MITLKREDAKNESSFVYDRTEDHIDDKTREFIEAYGKSSEPAGKNPFETENTSTVSSRCAGVTPYKLYLQQQLNRKAPEHLMSEEEFYEKEYGVAGSGVRKGTKSMRTHGKSKRRSYLILGAYVLIVAAISSIIIAVNGPSGKVNANERIDDGEQIEAMQWEREEGKDQNWFDRILDDVSNK